MAVLPFQSWISEKDKPFWEERCVQILDTLSKTGIELNPVPKIQSHPPLVYTAFEKGLQKLADFLISKSPSVISTAESPGFSPLLVCIEEGRWSRATFLLESCGANPNRKGCFWDSGRKQFMSPLCACLYKWKNLWVDAQSDAARGISEGAAGLVRLLVEKGARCDPTESGSEAPGGVGNADSSPPLSAPASLSPLLLACSLNPPSPSTIRLLISHAGADPNLPGLVEERLPDIEPSRPLEVALRRIIPPPSVPNYLFGGRGNDSFLSASNVQAILAVSTLLELGARTGLLSEQLRAFANMWTELRSP
uniref:Uncharacterized protein n=1 Tax=Chromera velia CCMP2878 TaxID=1169474 RepID=A0A0G4I7G5_9ALVE|mmetsp:Transcript_45952/g.90533  ORF Transcript_45952/g.90533 Transcript_45952/m.90533 type:complete len:308 (+) Transcript_45952:570-1493(+)|eukprot:Cvel_11632.t1-p1 / transcript=Cvel_11632.t1 / gene=Cvel_11632 / organism=Chromera_velia_CCMP2878 / gene_product=hypothetical protein / transcript_product=hypothetical protein / location=Cvel_scaffold736:61482-62884(+) / protein_length=307 / sequence_SO=supercontig / SO=protein_coding / is_pseudo=false